MEIDLSQRRIAVTGGAGFLGRAVVAALKAAGCRSVAVVRSRDHDLRTESGVRRFYDILRPEVVIHLAASSGGIGANLRHPGSFLYDNAVMGLQLVEFGRRAGVRKMVLAGTVCSYPRDAPLPFRERDLWNGHPEETNAPYGLAKRLLVAQAQGYHRQYGFSAVPLLLARP